MSNMIAREGQRHERLQRQLRTLKARLAHAEAGASSVPTSFPGCETGSLSSPGGEDRGEGETLVLHIRPTPTPDPVRPEPSRMDERSPANQPMPSTPPALPTVPGHQNPPQLSASGHFPSHPETHQPDHGLLPAPQPSPPNLSPELSPDAPDAEHAPPTDANGHDAPATEPEEERPGPYYMVLEGGVAGYVQRMRRKRYGLYYDP